MNIPTYKPYSDKSLAVKGDRKLFGNFIKALGGRWNSKLKCGEGWLIPKENEDKLIDFIEALKKRELESIKGKSKSVKEQNKYHRACSPRKSESEQSEEKTPKDVSDLSSIEEVKEEVKKMEIKKSGKKNAKTDSEKNIKKDTSIIKPSKKMNNLSPKNKSVSKSESLSSVSSISEDSYREPSPVKRPPVKNESRQYRKTPSVNKTSDSLKSKSKKGEYNSPRDKSPIRENRRNNYESKDKRNSHRSREDERISVSKKDLLSFYKDFSKKTKKVPNRYSRYSESSSSESGYSSYSPYSSYSSRSYSSSSDDFPSPRRNRGYSREYDRGNRDQKLMKKLKDIKNEVYDMRRRR